MDKMSESQELIEYKKESFFSKFKRKFLSIFSRKKKRKLEDGQGKIKKMNKQEFLDVYNSVKNNNIDLNTLDQKTLKEIVVKLKEELDINSDNVNQKLRTLDSNLIRYNKKNMR